MTGRRFAYVAHCLFDANAKVDEWALCAGVYRPLVERLRARGYTLRQLPCPELAHAGLNRFWQVKEQYDTPGYRRHCRRLAEPVAALMALDLAGGGDAVLVGVDGSPSMGVQLTTSGPDWGGRPDKPGDFDGEVVPGAGVFVEELLAALARRGIAGVRGVGFGQDLPGFDAERALRDVDRVLEG